MGCSGIPFLYNQGNVCLPGLYVSKKVQAVIPLVILVVFYVSKTFSFRQKDMMEASTK